MKFSKNNILELVIHIIGWGIVFAFPLSFIQKLNNAIEWDQYFKHLVMPVTMFFVFYINYFVLVPRYLCKSKTGQFIFTNLIIILIITAGQRIWSNLFFPPPPPLRPTPPEWIFFLRDMSNLIFTAVLSAAIRMSSSLKEAETARREAERERTEAELSNLRNQLNPHFLLNTLNNIYALTAFDTEKAQQAIQELSRLLRYLLYDNQQNFVPLQKEIDFIENYIKLMKIRISGNVEVCTEFNISNNSQTKVVPLIFISLIENAFKHGISPTEKSFIHIQIAEEKERIICKIENSNFPKNDNDKSGSGIGLEQVQKRLNLLHSGKYQWNKGVSDDLKTYISYLTIQTD